MADEITDRKYLILFKQFGKHYVVTNKEGVIYTDKNIGRVMTFLEALKKIDTPKKIIEASLEEICGKLMNTEKVGAM